MRKNKIIDRDLTRREIEESYDEGVDFLKKIVLWVIIIEFSILGIFEFLEIDIL